MHFYFPITIAGRRLHCFELKDASIEKPTPLFGFIVKVQDNTTLLSVDSDMAQLISSEGSNRNVDLSGHCFRVEKQEEGVHPIFVVHIEKGRATANPDNSDALKAYGYIGADYEDHKAVLKIDRRRVLSADNTLSFSRFTLIISYKDGEKIYQDAATIYLYTEDRQLVSAALDFGSEASQIRFGSSDENTSVIDTLLSFNSYAHSSADNNEVFWQGKAGDPLYKSVFFIHTNPKVTKYADKPQVGEANAFVQPLLSSTTPRSGYAPLELMPNLKLTEIGTGNVRFDTRRIVFPEGSDIDTGETSRLSDRTLRESILRLILSNFLHCMLKEIQGQDKFLRMVLMVPNVYYQSKIHTLIRDLYKDYETIQSALDKYPSCKGFEVQVVSESDAAFIGVRHNRRNLRNANQGLFLIVDAGKGTTDFSILQQHECFENFSSLYRDGIPASGNALTYAFYEALRSFLAENKIQLNPMLRSAEKSELLQFMSFLERFKRDYQKGAERAVPCVTPNATNVTNLTALNAYLRAESLAKHKIPGCDTFVDNKVEVLCKSLEASMYNYMKTNDVHFLQVLLTGRGFLFDPFKQAVIAMLRKNGWIDASDEDAVIRINGDEAKTICLVGALSVERECTVNCNSGLVGSPIVEKTANEGSWWERVRSKLFGKKPTAEAKGIDIDFFYEGSDSISDMNITVIIGGREYHPGNPEEQDARLFYTGNGFMLQRETDSEPIEERNFTFSDDTLSGLVMQSLFPFYPGSIPDDGEEEFGDAASEVKQEPKPYTPAQEKPEAASVPEKRDTGKEFDTPWK